MAEPGLKKNNTAFYVRHDDPPSKREILKAALHLFVRDGLCETSLRDIGRASGYSNTALFKFFRSKEELALYLFESCYRMLYGSFLSSQDKDHSYRDNQKGFVAAYLRIINTNLDAFLYVQDNLRVFWPQARAKFRQKNIITLTRKLLRQGFAEESQREPGRGELDVTLAAVVGLFQQFARLLFFKEIKGGTEQYLPALEDLMQRIIRF